MPNIVTRPVTMNTPAAVMRIAFIGSFCASASPTSTAGILAASMPSVVPSTTAASMSKRAPRATVASCVLSPISAMKKAMVVARKGP